MYVSYTSESAGKKSFGDEYADRQTRDFGVRLRAEVHFDSELETWKNIERLSRRAPAVELKVRIHDRASSSGDTKLKYLSRYCWYYCRTRNLFSRSL